MDRPGSLCRGSLRLSFHPESFRFLLQPAVGFLVSFSCAVKASYPWVAWPFVRLPTSVNLLLSAASDGSAEVVECGLQRLPPLHIRPKNNAPPYPAAATTDPRMRGLLREMRRSRSIRTALRPPFCTSVLERSYRHVHAQRDTSPLWCSEWRYQPRRGEADAGPRCPWGRRFHRATMRARGSGSRRGGRRGL